MRHPSVIVALVFTSLMAPPAAAAQLIKLPDRPGKIEVPAQTDWDDAAALYHLAVSYGSEERSEDAIRDLGIPLGRCLDEALALYRGALENDLNVPLSGGGT